MAIFDDINKLPVEPDPVYITGGIGLDHLARLKSINDKMPEKDIYETLSLAIGTLLSEKVVKNERDLIRYLFTNDKILLQISNVVAKTQFTHENRVYLNKILYSIIKNKMMDSEYKNSLIMNIARNNNNDIVPKLCSYVPEQIACNIGILRYSSFKETTNIQRVNDYLLGVIVPNEKAEQTIVNIYDSLYQRVTYLFETVMLDNRDKSLLTENENEVYGLQSLAVLDIVEQMPIEFIKEVLDSYYGDLNMIYSNMNPRFSLQSIAQSDYPRIIAIDRELSARRCYKPV